MYRKLLNPKFFRDNPVVEISAQRFVYSTVLHEELEGFAHDFVMERAKLSDERLACVASEKAMIQEQDTTDAIFHLMRKSMDVLSRPALVAKALEYEEDIVPMVIDKLVRSDHDTFIENAVRVLAKSKEDYTAQLHSRYSEFRSPYVKSLVCILIGFKAPESLVPWMMDTYLETNSLYPDENYSQGALLALYEFKARFYT